MRTLLSILRLYWRHYPLRLLWGTAIAVGAGLASITLLGTAGWSLGASMVAGVGAIAFLGGANPALIIRFAALIRTVGRYGERVVTHDTTFRFLAKMRLYVFDGISQLPFRRLRDFRSGELLARLTSDIDALDGVYLRVVLPLATAMLAALGLLLFLAGIDGLMTLVIAAIFLLTLILLPLHAARVGVKLGRRIALTSEALRLRYIDLLRGQVELMMAGRLDGQVSLIGRAADQIRDLQNQLSKQDHLGRSLINLASGFALVAVLLLGGWAYETGSLGLPALLFSILAVVALTELLVPIRRGLLDIGKAIYAGQRIQPLKASDAASKEDANTKSSSVKLEIERLRFGYSADAVPVFDDFSMSIRSGEAVGIVGTSGAGKSTLLSLIAGLLEHTYGSIDLAYEDPALREAQPRVGLLTQRTELFRESLAFNLRIAHGNATDEALEAAMKDAQLSSVLDREASRLDQHLGDEGQGLSGGESRRLALARLVLFQPDVWLLDEATEGLDPTTARALLKTLRRETEGKLLVFVTHKKDEAALADRLLILKEGKKPYFITRSDQDEWQSVESGLR